MVLSRADGFIGVLVDDLVTKGVNEPCQSDSLLFLLISSIEKLTASVFFPTLDRMFTSRSEYRVSLRADNADLRLTEKGRQVGVVSDKRWERYQSTSKNIEEGIEKLEQFRMAPEWWVSRGFEVRRDGNRRR